MIAQLSIINIRTKLSISIIKKYSLIKINESLSIYVSLVNLNLISKIIQEIRFESRMDEFKREKRNHREK